MTGIFMSQDKKPRIDQNTPIYLFIYISIKLNSYYMYIYTKHITIKYIASLILAPGTPSREDYIDKELNKWIYL